MSARQESITFVWWRQGSGGICLILGLASLVPLAVTFNQVAPVTVEPTAILGLASYLPLAYWVGLALLIAAFAVALFADGVGDLARFILLLLLGVYLLGIGTLVESNARMPEAYYPLSEVKLILQTGRVNISEEYQLVSYRSWPAIHFISATTMSVLGVPLSFIRYVPFVWILYFIFITWAVAKRVEISPRYQFLLPALGLASWWTTGDFIAKDIGILFYLLLLLLTLNPRGTSGEKKLAIIVVGALIITHGLTSVVVLLFLTVLGLCRREHRLVPRLVPFALVLLLAWYLYLAEVPLARAVQLQTSNPFEQLRILFASSHYATDAPVPTRVIFRHVQLAYIGLYALFLLGSGVNFLKAMVEPQVRRQILVLFLPLLSYLLLVGSFYGELETRLYFYGLVPVIGIILLTWRARPALLGLLTASMILLPIGRYAMEGAWGQVTTAELSGSEFVAKNVPQNAPYYPFHTWGSNIIFYFAPALVSTGYLSLAWYPGWDFRTSRLRDIDLSPLDDTTHVILSKQGSGALLLSFGLDPFQRWPETPNGQRANLVYSNAPYYRVYRNQPREGLSE